MKNPDALMVIYYVVLSGVLVFTPIRAPLS